MCDDIKHHWLHRVVGWLRLPFSRACSLLHGKNFYSILWKLGESERSFWRQNLSLFKNSPEEREVFSLSRWPRKILVYLNINTYTNIRNCKVNARNWQWWIKYKNVFKLSCFLKRVRLKHMSVAISS